MKSLIALAILSVALSAHAEEVYEFKGWKLGSAYADYENRAGFDCKPNAAPSTDKHCFNRAETIAGVWPNTLLLHFTNDKLAAINITFPSESFNDVTEALAHRWGKPYKSEDRTVQNRMGASFTNTRVTWMNKTGSILAERYSKTIDEARIMFISRKAADSAADKEKAKAAKRADDL